MSKIYLYIFFFLLYTSSFSQFSTGFVNAKYNPDGIFITPEFDAKIHQDLITSTILENNRFKVINEKHLQGYRLLISNAYDFNSEENLAKVLKNNRNDIQILIDKVNFHAGYTLDTKTLLKNNFPKGFFFRKPDHVNRDYDVWKKEYKRLGGIFIKALGEELISREQVKILNYANRFAIEHPEQLTVLHFNGRSRDPRWNDISKYSAGHWLYNPGTYLLSDIDKNDSIFRVADSSVFKTGLGIRNANNKNDDMVLVPVDIDGNKIWSEAEQVTLVALENGAIKVLRGRYGTKPRDFKGKTTYLAPHASEGPWGDKNENNLMWYYNLSTACPKDENGYQCNNVLSKEIGTWFKKDGITFAFDGIQFDIASWTVSKFTLGKRFVDVNVDGIADKGYINGRNVFGEGAYDFYKLLRQELSEDKIIVGDGGVDYGMRAVGVASGMESEGLCDWSDSYKEYAKPLSIFNYWNTYGIDNSFSYVTNKDTKGTFQDQKKRERMVLATATCLGISFNSFIDTPSSKKFRYGILDELNKGVEDELYWLGGPISDLIYVEDEEAFNRKLILRNLDIETVNCTTIIKNNDLIISSTENDANIEMKVRLKNIELLKGDLILSFDAKAKDSLIGFKPIVPRQIYANTEALQDTENTSASVLNYINSIEYLPCKFYYRKVTPGKADLEIVIEGGGEATIRNVQISNSQLALTREFEHGVVLVNPSLEPFTYNLDKLFPESKFKRLTASPLQDNKVNNGKAVEKSVTLPGLNGLFLIKNN